MTRLLKLGSVLMFLCVSTPVIAQTEASGAKELFFDPARELQPASSATRPVPHVQRQYDASGRRTPQSTNPEIVASLGLSYWIELADTAGRPRGPVTNEHVFRSGDRIRLHFRGNCDGRIMLLQLGSSGVPSILFPDPSKGMSENGVRASDDRTLPSSTHWFKFDSNPGAEQLLVLFARNQGELETTLAEETAPDRTEVRDGIGRKDLLIETETSIPSEVGTYAVSRSGKPIVLQIVLKHR